LTIRRGATAFRAQRCQLRRRLARAFKDDDGAIYHTYSTYGRGGEVFLPVYAWLDVVPKGRSETKNGNLTDWVRRHDRYEDDGRKGPASPTKSDAP
jgi:predicted dithiol-disulfide oxidoreductase (DUF899 family)